MKQVATMVFLAGLISPVMRAELPPGTWLRRAVKDGSRVMMTIEFAGTGRVLTYRIERPDGKIRTLVVATELDGMDTAVLVDGKPSTQTMAFRTLDNRHTVSVAKLNGMPVSTQKFELASDGKGIKVQTIPSNGEQQQGVTDYWDKQ